MAPRDRSGIQGSPGQNAPTSDWSMFQQESRQRAQERAREIEREGMVEYDMEVEDFTATTKQPRWRAPDPGPPGNTAQVFNLDQVYDPDDPSGIIGSVVATLAENFANHGAASIENQKDDYMNNFIVNLHNHSIPFPIPLQYFITDINIAQSNQMPYQSVSMSLKIPYELAMGLFTGGNAHPEPGQWLCIRQLENDDDARFHETNPFRPRNWEQGLGNQFGEALTDLVFLGTISSLKWDINCDQVTGQMTAAVQVQANSFIHNLVYAEYSVKNALMNDQDLSEFLDPDFDTQDAENPDQDQFVDKNAFLKNREPMFNESTKYYLNWSDWYRFIKTSAAGNVGKVKLKDALSAMLSALAYPQLPISLQFEPTDFASWFIDIARSGMDIVSLMKRLYFSFGEKIGRQLVNGAISVMEVLQIENPLVDASGVYTTGALLYLEAMSGRVGYDGFEIGREVLGGAGPGMAVNEAGDPGQDQIREIEDLATFLGNPYANDQLARLGDIRSLIHVATSRADIPPSHPLWGSMPHEDIPFIDLNRIKNLNMNTTTVWDLIRGTFQPDNQVIELFPTILSVSNRDVVDWYEAAGNKIHPTYKALGGVPTIVLRLKPMHPIIGKQGISKRTLDREKDFNAFRGAAHFSYRERLQYLTATEKVDNPVTGRNMKDYKDSSYGEKLPYGFDPTMSITHPDYGGSLCLPVPLYKYEIVNMSFSQADTARINSVKVNSPELKNMSGRSRNVMEGEMIHNVEMALRHGWRSYNPIWPYREYRGAPNTKPSAEQAVNTGRIMTALSERIYMIYGDDQMYFRGQIVCKSQIRKSITPGCWMEILMGENAGMAPRLQNMLVYVTGIVHAYDVDPLDGEVTMSSTITFERGSYGGIVANLPSYKGPTIDLQTYMETLGVPYNPGEALTLTQANALTDQPIAEMEPPRRQVVSNEAARRMYVALRLQKGDLTPQEGQQIIASGNIPADDYTLYQSLVQRFGGNSGHDPSGTP